MDGWIVRYMHVMWMDGLLDIWYDVQIYMVRLIRKCMMDGKTD